MIYDSMENIENIVLPIIRRMYPRSIMDDIVDGISMDIARHIVDDISIDIARHIDNDIINSIEEQARIEQEILGQEFIKEEEMIL